MIITIISYDLHAFKFLSDYCILIIVYYSSYIFLLFYSNLTWSCCQCTFANPPSAHLCQMCHHEKRSIGNDANTPSTSGLFK